MESKPIRDSQLKVRILIDYLIIPYLPYKYDRF
jgi:hypothetical protein